MSAKRNRSFRLGTYFWISVFLFLSEALQAIAQEKLTESPVVSSSEKTLFVEVQGTKLRKEPRHWSPAVTDLAYGDSLQELAEENQWERVRTKNGLEGYVHLSAITSRKIVIQGKGSADKMHVAESDIVLAGKGFNKELESSLASSTKALNYEAVNYMETLVVSGSVLEQFLRGGKLLRSNEKPVG